MLALLTLTIAAFERDHYVETIMTVLNTTMSHLGVSFGHALKLFTVHERKTVFKTSSETRNAEMIKGSTLWPGLKELMKCNVFVELLSAKRLTEWVTKAICLDVSRPNNHSA